jgi:hypothetical protein
MQWDNKNGRYTEYGFDPTNWLEQTQPASLINFAEPISKKDEPF